MARTMPQTRVCKRLALIEHKLWRVAVQPYLLQ